MAMQRLVSVTCDPDQSLMWPTAEFVLWLECGHSKKITVAKPDFYKWDGLVGGSVEDFIRHMHPFEDCGECVGEEGAKTDRPCVPKEAACPPGPWWHQSTYVDHPCDIGTGTRIWHFCHVEAGAKIGRDCTIGQGCYIGKGAVIGDRVRIQNNVSVYTGVTIEDDCFVGPSVVFTNVRLPQAGVKVPAEKYEPTFVKSGAVIGANATIRCGVTIGSDAVIGAGAVVTKDVPADEVWVGNPAAGAVVKAQIVEVCP